MVFVDAAVGAAYVIFVTSLRLMGDVLRSACLCACLSFCLFVCLSARISQKPHVHISRNFLHVLIVTVVRSSFNGNTLCYILLVL